MNLFERTLQFAGFPIQRAKQRLREIQAIAPADYEAYVENLRKNIVDYHLRENTYYQHLVGDTPFTSWKDVPVLTKGDLQRPLGERLSHGYTKKNCYINKTSGSSGHPFIFAKDKFCHALSWAEFIDRYTWYDITISKSLQARFYGIPMEGWGYRRERLKDRLSGRYRFPIFDLSESKMEQFLSVFRSKKFDHINGYTSSIVLFGKYLQKQNICLKDVCATLRVCIVTSEMLFPEDQEMLEHALGVPVVNEYGASELGLIAFTDTNGKFVVNSEALYVEILDGDDLPVPLGETGRIVITSLYNRAHPIIRYDIGDTGCLSVKSTSKKPILERLVGRTNDVAQLANGKSVPGLTFYYVTKSAIEEDVKVKEFIVEQHTREHFKIIYVADVPFSELRKQKIEKALHRYVDADVSVEFDRVALLKRENSGKLKQFVSKL
ncbi:MAG: AMP-binding protein [Flavobacteriaceae bacterium]|nr:AMP-binding protein [Flavobacteriaceae bacterium]